MRQFSSTFNKTTLFLICCVWIACKPVKEIEAPPTNITETLSLATQVQTSSVFSKSFTGFALYDIEEKTMIDSYEADKYYTPASNTKIFTCYSSLKILGDSIPALQYLITGDSLIFWGTGDPSLLNSNLGNNDVVINFLKSRREKLFYAPQWSGEHFGAGWAWDDYNDYYSAEMSSLPIYGNVATFRMAGGSSTPTVHPKYFQSFTKENTNYSRTTVKRHLNENVFEYHNPNRRSYSKEVPFKTSSQICQILLEGAIGKEIGLNWQVNTLRNHSEVQTIYSMKKDDMLSVMMKASDNFVAEQLLLMCAYQKNKSFSRTNIIKYVKTQLLSDSPDKLVWVDGSGLSRYNLFTPRTMVYTLNKMQEEFGMDRLMKIFAVGGVSGTIRKWYKGETAPYVFAKTGTLSNKHCLSGFIKTKSGKVLVFSFMHNNYISSSSVLKKEMEVFLKRIHEDY